MKNEKGFKLSGEIVFSNFTKSEIEKTATLIGLIFVRLNFVIFREFLPFSRKFILQKHAKSSVRENKSAQNFSKS